MSYAVTAKYMATSKSFVANWAQQYKKIKNVDDLPERDSIDKVTLNRDLTVSVAIVVAAVTVTLVLVLGEEETISFCNGTRIYEKAPEYKIKSGLKSHIEKLQRHGPPPLEGPKTRATEPSYGWITQRIDHFDPTNLGTWRMRYMNNSEFYEDGGPMFIFLGGEWEISREYLMTGQMYDMAQEHTGYMFYTEHRYYGESFPTTDLTIENLQFQSADQALADIAYFIEYQKLTIPGMENSKVVVVGGSYSAMLATWMRIKYPHLVDAALSSSAPLRSVADFYEYFEVVGNSLKTVSEECVSTIAEAMTGIDKCFETAEGVAHVSDLLGMENSISTSEPAKSYFFSALAGPFAQLVQYASGPDLEDACSLLLSFEGDAFDKFIAFINLSYGNSALTDYEYYVNYLRQTNIIKGSIARQWYYQTCTEYGFYQTSASPDQPFKNFELELFLKSCEDVYGISEEVLNTGIERSNLFFGSVSPEVTKVVSTHGTVDPWHPLGVLEDLNPEAPVFVIQGASHCADLSSLRDADSDEMKLAKTKLDQDYTALHHATNTIDKYCIDCEEMYTNLVCRSGKVKTSTEATFHMEHLISSRSVGNEKIEESF
ncbi:hypothetical protein Trydic_g21629 [Trypoxylus dichotomus]